jgi:hypothetical protein
MVHWHYIGFFDPRMPIDLSQKPAPPLPTRPLSPEVYERLAGRFGVKLGEEVADLGGYLLSHLGSFGQLHPFEAELVALGCVVLTEMRLVVQPPEAVEIYNAAVADWAAKRAEPLSWPSDLNKNDAP